MFNWIKEHYSEKNVQYFFYKLIALLNSNEYMYLKFKCVLRRLNNGTRDIPNLNVYSY